MSESSGRRGLSAARGRLALVVAMVWARVRGRRWFVEWDGDGWRVIGE